MTHLLALVGLTLLCAAWIAFQLWLKRLDPDKGDFHPGCGACQGGSCHSGGCATDNEKTVTTVGLSQTGPGGSSGEE